MYVVFKSRTGMTHYVWYDPYKDIPTGYRRTLCGWEVENMTLIDGHKVKCSQCNKKFMQLLTEGRTSA